jgi:hypothetical protein
MSMPHHVSKQSRANFDACIEDYKRNFDSDLQDLSLKKSLTAVSRSSSDKFSRLQKLEKKNLNEENLEQAEFTLTKTNINFFAQ